MSLKIIIKLSKYVLTACILLGSCHVTNTNTVKNENQLKKSIDTVIKSNNFNGVVLLTKGNNTLYSNSTGYADFENKTLLSLNSQFVIGSISKQITAVLVLQSYELGAIKLEDTINEYLTDINQPWTKDVTIHHLLTHTHGIVDIQKPLEFKPGSQFQYSQLGFELLAHILEKVTGKTFEQLSTALFNVHELTNTFHPYNKQYKNLVKGYEQDENGTLNYATNSLDNFVAAGSFISTVSDLNKWNILLHSGKLVKAETLELMSTRYATRQHPIFSTIEYGYGLLFKEGEAKKQIGALGYAPGFVSSCHYYPEKDINLVILENTAYKLNDFKTTFKTHTALMELVKSLNE